MFRPSDLTYQRSGSSLDLLHPLLAHLDRLAPFETVSAETVFPFHVAVLLLLAAYPLF